MSSNGYRSIDDLLADAIDADRRRSFEGEDWGELIASGHMDEDDYALTARELELAEEKSKEWWEEYYKTPEQKAVDAAKKKEEQDNYDYVYKGIVRESFLPTPRDIERRELLLANREKTKNVPFPFE